MTSTQNKTKYEALFEEFQRRIEKLAPGTRLPTVRDLMREYKVSQATVDRALDILESKKLLERKNGHGLFSSSPSACENGQKQARVLLAFHDYPSIAKDQLIGVLRRSLSDAGHSVQTQVFNWQDRILRSIPNHSCDVLLVMPDTPDLTNSDMLRLQAFNIPFLFLDQGPVSWPANVIRSDNALGGAMAAMRLAKLGHKRLAIFVGEPNTSGAVRDRISGFERQCALLKLPPPEIFDCKTEHGESAAGKTCAMAKALLETGRTAFSAAFCVSDNTAIGLLHALYKAGVKVPEELSVVSFDGTPDGAFFNPALSGMAHDLDAFAGNALKFIDESLSGKIREKPFQALVAPKFIERESAAKPSRKDKTPIDFN